MVFGMGMFVGPFVGPRGAGCWGRRGGGPEGCTCGGMRSGLWSFSANGDDGAYLVHSPYSFRFMSCWHLISEPRVYLAYSLIAVVVVVVIPLDAQV